MKGASVINSYLNFYRNLKHSLRGMNLLLLYLNLDVSNIINGILNLTRNITHGFCRRWIDFNPRVMYFRLLYLSIAVPLLAPCASLVITFGRAPLWDSEMLPGSKPIEAEWYIFMFLNWSYFYSGAWGFPRKVLVLAIFKPYP